MTLKKGLIQPIHLGHDIYLAYLHQLLVDGDKNKYLNVKQEYEKLIDKYFTRASLIHINLQAVEFDSKLERDKTKDLEKDALAVLKGELLPKNYRTTERIVNFLYDVSQKQRKYESAEKYSDPDYRNPKGTVWRNVSGISSRENTVSRLLS